MAPRAREPEPPCSGGALAERRRAMAMGLVAATTIVLQVALTRVLSVVVWYHWAFLAVSLAMLGIAAPGVWFSFVRERRSWLRRLLVAAGITVPAAVVVIVHSPAWVGAGAAPWLCLAAALAAFLTLGGATCLLLLSAPGSRVGRIYGADLIGASAGACATVPLLSLGPTPIIASALGFLPWLAYLILWPRRALVLLGPAIALLVALGWGAPFAVRHTKTYTEAGLQRPLYERWSPTVRVTVFDNVFWTGRTGPFLWGAGRDQPARSVPEQYWIEQDGSAGTPITRFTGDLAELEYLLDDVTAVGYEVRPPRRVAVIGAGGGRDVLTALVAGARQVDAIELHRIILDTVRYPFGEFSGHLYDDPRVTPLVGDGRHVLQQREARYDLIQIALIDSWSATTAGAYTLAENHLYTVEAYRLFWSRLSDTGLVSTSRWLRGSFGLEVPRLLLLAKEALAQEGVGEPSRHLAVVQGGAVGNVLLSRRPLDPPELLALRRIARDRGFVVHFPPAAATTEDPTLSRVFEGGPEIYAREGVRMTPPTDDRPFFFQTLSPFGRVSRPVAQSLGVNAESVWTLQLLMGLTVIATGALVLLPFLFTSRFERTGLWTGTLYFVCIGIGFMFTEVTWMQKLILVTGHPSWAATVVLGALLVGMGIGSSLAERLRLERLQRYGWLTPVAMLAAVGMGPLLLTGSWVARMLLAACVLAAIGATTGPWFALGLARFGDANKPWFWAANGAASVVGGVCALGFAMEIGYTRVAILGLFLYLLAWWAVRGTPVPAAEAIEP